MRNSVDLLNVIKKAAMDAMNASQPSDFCFGKVTSMNPLKILVEQKMTLGKAQLVMTETVSKVSLKQNDEVVLLKKKGGQKYLILDKVVKL